MKTTETTLRRQRRDGEHEILETATPQVLTSSIYPDRVTLLIGKKHILRLSKEDAAWLGEHLTKAAKTV